MGVQQRGWEFSEGQTKDGEGGCSGHRRGAPRQMGRDVQTKSKSWGGGALSKRTPGQLRSDRSLLKSKPKAPAIPAPTTYQYLVSKCE